MADSQALSNILILTCSGGAGHLQAARIKKHQLQKKYPNADFFELDLLDDWRKDIWNTALTSGNVFLQRCLGKLAFFASFLFWPFLFFQVLRILEEKEIDLIVDTQVLGTHPIIKALKTVSKRQNKTILYQKVIIELSTERAKIYFKHVQKLTKQDRKHVQLFSQKPLLRENQTEEEFWQKTCKLPLSQIYYDEPLVLQEFIDATQSNHLKDACFNLSLNLTNPSEKDYYVQTFPPSEHTHLQSNTLDLNIKPSDFIALIMLGSQPADTATIQYCLSLIEKTKNELPFKQFKLFIFCGHPQKKATLYQRLTDTLASCALETHQSIYPLFYQSAQVVAPLIARSDLSITRSGAITSQELRFAASGTIMIHSECPYLEPSKTQLLQGMPEWEAGNAEYLGKEKGAILVTPAIFQETLKKTLSTLNRRQSKEYSIS